MLCLLAVEVVHPSSVLGTPGADAMGVGEKHRNDEYRAQGSKENPIMAAYAYLMRW